VNLRFSCRDCGRRWNGRNEAHCATCHEHFSAPDNFTRHRVDGVCAWPGGVYRGPGRPYLRLAERAGGPTWVSFDERSKDVAYTPVITPGGVR